MARSRVHSFIAVATSNDMTKRPAGPVFGAIPSRELVVHERIDGQLANSIYKKLDEKNQLGKLLSYSEKGWKMVKYIRSVNDIIDVLYIAHHGRRFTEYFTDWLKTAQNEKQFPVFQALTLLTSLGVSQIKINLLPTIADAVGCIDFDYTHFLEKFGSFCYEKTGRLCLRCPRLFGDTVLDLMNSINRKSTIAHLAAYFGSILEEYDHTYYSDIFQHIVRASSLTKILDLSANEALETLIDLRGKCNHLSYYWIQVGILYRRLSDFSNAENAFENAKEAHGKDNYQIAHARAKNYMEWGLWAIDHAPTQASELFTVGANEMGKLQLRWRYSDAICFAMHSYVDMSLKYYSKKCILPDEDTWDTMVKRTERYAENTNDTDDYLFNLIVAMEAFGETHSLPTGDIIQLRCRMRIGHAVTIPSGLVLDDDALPAYD